MHPGRPTHGRSSFGLRGGLPLPALVLVATAAPASAAIGAPAALCEELRPLSVALADGVAPPDVTAAILEQLRSQKPVAFVEGFWVTPIDLEPARAAAAARRQSTEPLPITAARPRLALALTDTALRDVVPLPFVGDFPHLPPAAEPQPRVMVVPLEPGADALFEYLAPDGECLYFCLDPSTWDFDGDKQPNAADPDDDGDGVDDEADAFPYWPRASRAPREGTFYLGLSGKLSRAVADTVLAAYDGLVADRGRELPLGGVGERGELYLVLPDCAPARGRPMCPDSSDPSVQWVSRDPAACARLRFRCDPGQVPFSSACGCGCRPAAAPASLRPDGLVPELDDAVGVGAGQGRA